MPDSRTQRFRGRSPPGRPEWSVSTVCRRGTNTDETVACAVTEAEVSLTDSHFYVTLRCETRSPVRPDAYEQLVVADGALGKLDEWLEGGETGR